MNFKRFLVMALTALLFFAASAATHAADTIRFAVPTPLTGQAASYGDNIKAGVTMKVDEINAKGGINGKKLEAVFFDDQCDPKEAATVATKIVGDDSLLAIVGHLCSGAHLAGLPNYVRTGIAAISPTATDVSIAEKGKDESGKHWSFRNVYNNDFQGAFLADYVSRELGLKKVAVFYATTDYGVGLKDAFAKEAHAIGLEIVGQPEAYKEGITDFTPQLTKMKEGGPQGIFIAGYYPEGALIADQAKKLGMDIPKFGADGLDNADYIKLGGPAVENTYFTAPFLPEVASPEGKAFAAAFKAKYNRDVDWMSANAYDATGIIAQAVAKVGPDRAKIREYLAAMDSKEKAYKGITGLTYFDGKGDCVKPAFVKMVKDGKFTAAEKQMR